MIPLRDSRRREGFPVTTYSLILINLIVFMTYRYRLGADPGLLKGLVLVPGKVEWCLDNLGAVARDPFVLVHILVKPFLASIFLHADWPHLLGNMWFLFVFGSTVEGRMKPFRFLAFYLACGVAAGVFHVAIVLGDGSGADLFGRIAHFGVLEKDVPVIGASGAVAGLLGAYFVLFPLARILVFLPPFFIFQLPALLFLGIWFAFQLFSARAASGEGIGYGGVAWWAHVGGFLAGVAVASFSRLFQAAPEREKAVSGCHGS